MCRRRRAAARSIRGSRWHCRWPSPPSLAALCLLPSVRQHAALARSILGAAGFLVVWTGLFFYRRAGRGTGPWGWRVVLRKQHYLQACAQFSVMLYWGWYWREVYDSLHLIAAQLLFAYAFDMLLAWSRREKYTLGFGPFPDHLQHQPVPVVQAGLVLSAVPDGGRGFPGQGIHHAGKRTGKRAHIFNPSSFPLGLFSLGLILTGTTGITWGQEIAHDLRVAAAHPAVDLPRRPAGTVPVRRHHDDHVRGPVGVRCSASAITRSSAPTISSTRSCPRRCFSACICCSPIRRRRRAANSAASSTACCTAWASSRCTACSGSSARRRSTTSCWPCR